MRKSSEPRAVFSRRTLLRAGLATGVAGALGPALSSCSGIAHPGSIVVAGGESGGFYLEFATLLAASLKRHRVGSTATVLSTGGSLDNLSRLLTGEAALAVALADATSLEVGPQGQDPGRVAALGKVYENYVHAVVRKDSSISSINDLAGRTVAVGQPGSGTSLITSRLFDVANLSETASRDVMQGASITVSNLGLNDGIAALSSGSVDALFFCGGVPTAAIAEGHATTGFRLLDLSGLLPGLRKKYGAFYDRVLIPAGSYAGMGAVWTIGVANLLLCRLDLAPETVQATVNLLVAHADELIPQSSTGAQFLSPDSLINTADIPLHPAAATEYRRLHG